MMRLSDYDDAKAAKAEAKDRERRAQAAYWRNAGVEEHPHPPESAYHVEHDGLEYVVLHADAAGDLAIYRVRNDGQLKRMKRPPDLRENGRVIEV